MLPVVQCRSRKGAFNSEVVSSLQGKVIEVTPSTIGGDDDLSVIRKVELNCVKMV